jgi:hypothetical protein
VGECHIKKAGQKVLLEEDVRHAITMSFISLPASGPATECAAAKEEAQRTMNVFSCSSRDNDNNDDYRDDAPSAAWARRRTETPAVPDPTGTRLLPRVVIVTIFGLVCVDPKAESLRSAASVDALQFATQTRRSRGVTLFRFMP